MNFLSDNVHGIDEAILAAMVARAAGTASSYGEDELTGKVEARFREIFGCDLRVFPVTTGTAANALSLSLYTPPHGTVFCHAQAHVMVDECGAPEMFCGGAKLVGLDGEGGKINAATLGQAVDDLKHHVPHQGVGSCVSLSQSTEMGQVYDPGEIAGIAAAAHERGMGVHMDGARFANALVALGCSPAAMTWQAGVDVLSFGATKNGAAFAEAIVLFDLARADELMYRRKRAGQLLSKGRFLAAQFDAYLDNGHWLELARRANAMAARLGQELQKLEGVDLAVPVQANEVFVRLPPDVHARLVRGGALYYDWPGGKRDDGRILARFVCSFATTAGEIAACLSLADGRSSPEC